jgi:hypothetical protein
MKLGLARHTVVAATQTEDPTALGVPHYVLLHEECEQWPVRFGVGSCLERFEPFFFQLWTCTAIEILPMNISLQLIRPDSAGRRARLRERMRMSACHPFDSGSGHGVA